MKKFWLIFWIIVAVIVLGIGLIIPGHIINLKGLYAAGGCIAGSATWTLVWWLCTGDYWLETFHKAISEKEDKEDVD